MVYLLKMQILLKHFNLLLLYLQLPMDLTHTIIIYFLMDLFLIKLLLNFLIITDY